MAKKIPVNYDTSREFSKKSTGQNMVSNGQTAAKKMLNTATPTVSKLFQTAGGTTGKTRTMLSSGSTTGNAKDTMVDPTKQAQATTQQDVDNQDWRTRLWQSLETTYGARREASDKQYDLAYNQADRQATSRGMGRSSYNNATLANLSQEKVKAGDQIYAEQIADYQNRLTEQEKWQQEYDEKKRQFDEQMAYQKERANVSDEQWQKEYDEKLRQFNEEMERQRQRDTVADEQWNKEYEEKLREFNEQMARQKDRDKVSDEQWQKEYDEKRRQFEEQMALEREKFDLQKSMSSGSSGSPSSNPSSNPTNNPPQNPGTNNEDPFNLDDDKNSTPNPAIANLPKVNPTITTGLQRANNGQQAVVSPNMQKLLEEAASLANKNKPTTTDVSKKGDYDNGELKRVLPRKNIF